MVTGNSYRIGWVIVLSLGVILAVQAADRPMPSAERGQYLLQTRAFNPPIWPKQVYENVWKSWGESERPADFERQLMERYGLHPAPFDNKGYPLGLREARSLLGVGVTTDCMICHGGSIFERSYVGLGNSSLDLQLLYEDMAKVMGRSRATPFPFTNVRGTTEAGAMAVFLFQLRDADLKLRPMIDLGLRADLCEDAPAWWLLKKKRTMYYTGSTNARSVRSIMQFMLTPLNSAEDVKKQEPAFADIQAFILSLEPPKYPLPIDRDLAERGEKLFAKHCSSCHGTYGENPTYPNKIIDLDLIGTDPTRAEGFTLQAKHHYDNSWFGQELDAEGRRMETYAHRGYQAPPLDGVWATAPYLHNGSVPTLYHLLNSASRPRIFTRSFRTGIEDYDSKLVGWKVQVLEAAPPDSAPPAQRRRVYDTTQPGRGNQGHTFGDKLSEEERFAVIEYLKTL